MNKTSLVLAMWVLAGSAAAASVSSVPLGKGTVDVRTYETGVTIHAYLTNDAMADSAFIVETQEGLVGFKSPAFVSDIPLWKDYVAKLGKPLKALFLSNHPSDGKEWYGDAEVLTTARSQKAMKEVRRQSSTGSHLRSANLLTRNSRRSTASCPRAR